MLMLLQELTVLKSLIAFNFLVIFSAIILYDGRGWKLNYGMTSHTYKFIP